MIDCDDHNSLIGYFLLISMSFLVIYILFVGSSGYMDDFTKFGTSLCESQGYELNNVSHVNHNFRISCKENSTELVPLYGGLVILKKNIGDES